MGEQAAGCEVRAVKKQFGTFDTLDDRRELFILMERLGKDLPEEMAKRKRAAFLQGLIPESCSAMAEQMQSRLRVNPEECNPYGAYMLFVAITGILEVPIAIAAKLLDEAVKNQ